MGLDVAKVTLELLDRPEGTAYEFARHLALECGTAGEGNAFGFFLRSQIHRLAADYIECDEEIEHDWRAHNEILDWVESLPYDESGYVSLNFNW